MSIRNYFRDKIKVKINLLSIQILSLQGIVIAVAQNFNYISTPYLFVFSLLNKSPSATATTTPLGWWCFIFLTFVLIHLGILLGANPS